MAAKKMSMKDYEKSGADAKADKAGLKAMNAKGAAASKGKDKGLPAFMKKGK